MLKNWEYNTEMFVELLESKGVKVVGGIQIEYGSDESGFDIYKVTVNGSVYDIATGIMNPYEFTDIVTAIAEKEVK